MEIACRLASCLNFVSQYVYLAGGTKKLVLRTQVSGTLNQVFFETRADSLSHVFIPRDRRGIVHLVYMR